MANEEKNKLVDELLHYVELRGVIKRKIFESKENKAEVKRLAGLYKMALLKQRENEGKLEEIYAKEDSVRRENIKKFNALQRKRE